MKINLEIEVNNIKVDNSYFSFDWVVIIGNHKESDTYDSSHEWGKLHKKQFQKELENGYAYDLVLERLFPINIKKYFK